MSAAHPADDPITMLRLQLLRNGWVPLPVTSPDYRHEKVKNPGKQPFFKGWDLVTAETITPEMVAGWPQTVRNHTNTGLVANMMAAVDIDVPVADIALKLEGIANTLLGVTPFHRVGKAPKLLMCYRVDAPLKKRETPELFLPDGTKTQIEILADGQQFVAFGVHPDTGRDYEWLDASPLDAQFNLVPLVKEDALRSYLAAAEAVLRAAGGRTEKEIEAAKKAEADPAGADKGSDQAGGGLTPRPVQGRPAAISSSRSIDGRWKTSARG
jgi:putative DNA primase/helicase